MSNKRVFNAETNKRNKLSKLMGMFFKNAHAEEGNLNPDDNKADSGSASTINFEQMIAQARKEEKEKLYPRLQKAEEENKVLTTSNNKYLLENAALKDELEKLKNKSQDNKEVLELKSKLTALEDENKNLKENSPNEEEIRQKIEEEYEVKLYAKDKVNENKDKILSIFAPEVKGNTKEEVDKVLVELIEKTNSVKKDLGLDIEDSENNSEKNTEKKPEKKSTQVKSTEKKKRVPVASPSVEEDEEYDMDYVRNLDPGSEEYAEFRKKMGLR